jgi:N-acetylglucosamine-6-phosphate deacetylase
MSTLKCRGNYIFSGELVEVEFDRLITHIDPILDGGADPLVRSRPPGRLAPGFIDLQVNGFAGVDYNSPQASIEDIGASIRALFATGVTRFFPTVITGPPESMLGALRNLTHARETLPEGAAIEAIHVEGPHISPQDGPRGAHPARWVRPPDLEEYRRWQDAASGNVRLITLSPEWPDASRYIEYVTRDGVVASIGHTQATPEQIQDAVRAGATLSTHLGNALHPARPREPHCLWEQLAEDRLAASFIVDGLHLTGAFLRVALRGKGIEPSVLITDAVAPAMCAPGDYRLGEVEVELKPDDRVVLRGGTRLAGSSLRMDRAIGNVMRQAGLSLTEAVSMATSNPARVGRVAGRLRGLQPGQRADIVRFQVDEGRLQVLETYLNGQRVYSST